MLRIVRSIFIMSLLAFTARAQISQPIIDKVVAYPTSFRHYEGLSQRITKDFHTDRDRAAAIYVWIAKNIAYDTKVKSLASARFTYRTAEEKRQKEEQMRTELALMALKKKKAVCQGYSELYRVLCRACGIDCEVAGGYSKTEVQQIGLMPKVADHAWNVVKLDGQWQLVDVTWGAGYVADENDVFVPDFSDVYFCMPSQLFGLNHYPEDKRWLMVNLSEKQFAEQALFHRGFMSSGIQIIHPAGGTITKAKGGTIRLEVAGSVSPDQFAYAFKDQKYRQKIVYEQKGERLFLIIPLGDRKKTYLDLILNGEAIVTYKLNLR